MLLYSTQWFSVIGHLFPDRSESEWTLVDQNWYEFGEIPYSFRIDPEFGKLYAARLQRPRHADRDRRLSRLSDRHRHRRRAQAAQSEQRHSRVGRLVQHLRGARRDARPRPRRAHGDRPLRQEDDRGRRDESLQPLRGRRDRYRATITSRRRRTTSGTARSWRCSAKGGSRMWRRWRASSAARPTPTWASRPSGGWPRWPARTTNTTARCGITSRSGAPATASSS